MKFAHIADCHIGGWRDQKMKDLPLLSFVKAIDMCVEKKVDFILISGDLFNTSHPPIDNLKVVVTKLKEVHDKNIPVYMVAGSHDFSATGKTMIDVLEEAGLVKNVVKGTVEEGKLKLKFTIDKKTGAKIAGMLGKKGSLEKKYYDSLDLESLEKESGFKIFMFHTSIAELKPKELEKMEAEPLSILPRGFDYYAGGHVHIVERKDFDGYKNVVYPGPIFPNSFRELELLDNGGFYLYENGRTEYEKIEINKTEKFHIDCDNKTPEDVTLEIEKEIEEKDFENKIILIRVAGKLKIGRPKDIDFHKLINKSYEKGAYFVMKSTTKVESMEFEEVMVNDESVESIEDKIIDEYMEKSIFEKEKLKKIMHAFSIEKMEDEKIHDYEKRLIDEMNKIIDN